MDNKRFFKEAGYGMMVHFGLYSLLGGEYRGKKSSAYAEWIGSYFGIPEKEYEQLAKVFNPIYFDAEEWVRFARDCGMKYIVITTKHHEGFALFRSACDPYNICDASPFGRDLIAELADACRKYGLRLGFYYSQDLDWHEKHGGGYLSRHIPCAGVSWDNSWDWNDVSDKDFSVCFEKKILPQVTELMTNYGDVLLTWFDVPMTINAEQSRRLYETVKKYQPDCLVNSRIGNGTYDYVSLGDNEIPADKEAWERISRADPADTDYQSIHGFKPSPWGLYESACTLNDSWGFSYRDHNWKSPEQLYRNRKHLNDLGINYLINVGPDPLGRIPGEAQDILRRAAELAQGDK